MQIDHGKSVITRDELELLQDPAKPGCFKITWDADMVTNFYLCAPNVTSNVLSYSLFIDGVIKETFRPCDLEKFVSLSNKDQIPLEFTIQTFYLVTLHSLYDLSQNPIEIHVTFADSLSESDKSLIRLIYNKTLYNDQQRDIIREKYSNYQYKVPATIYIDSDEFSQFKHNITDLTIENNPIIDHIVIWSQITGQNYTYDRQLSQISQTISDKLTTGIYIPLNIDLSQIIDMKIIYYDNFSQEIKVNPRIRLTSEKIVNYCGGYISLESN
jgi:hypothetical protein